MFQGKVTTNLMWIFLIDYLSTKLIYLYLVSMTRYHSGTLWWVCYIAALITRLCSYNEYKHTSMENSNLFLTRMNETFAMGRLRTTLINHFCPYLSCLLAERLNRKQLLKMKIFNCLKKLALKLLQCENNFILYRNQAISKSYLTPKFNLLLKELMDLFAWLFTVKLF